MTVALPTGAIVEASPRFIDRGGVLEATLGGPDQRLDRLGSKFGASFNVKPMKGEDARIWIARLIRGRSEKASIKFPQPGILIEWPGDGVIGVGAAANAVSISVNRNIAGEVGKRIREGEFISIIHAGVRYLHQATADAPIVGLGGGIYGAVIAIQPPLRSALVVNDVVEVLMPTIEGYVRGDERSWTIDNAKIYGLQFDIEEAQ
jgi:hypothetical protein